MLSGVCLAVKRSMICQIFCRITKANWFHLVQKCVMKQCFQNILPVLHAMLSCSIVGIVGLLCPSITDVISRLAGQPEAKLLQVSAGDSPQTRHYRQNYRVVTDQGCAVVMLQ